MRHAHKVATIILVILTFLIAKAYALEKATHFELNGKIVDLSGLDGYLKDTKIFLNGTKEIINGKRIEVWIQFGGQSEDEPLFSRSFNHYLNPLSNAGYLGLFKSASQWAQEQGSFGSFFGGNYSWPAVRQYYFLGLTSSVKADRDKNLADTFRGVGQLMHLVEDMSVPAHTRNDAHIFYNYEDWVDNIRATDTIKFQNLLLNPVYYGGTLNGISSFFDTNQYTLNSGPDVTGNLTTINGKRYSNIGLSEYTQANFFSEDTINDLSHFPYPKITGNMPIKEKTAPNSSYQRQYYLKNCCGETKPPDGYLLSAVDYLDYYRQQYPSLSFALPKIPVLDNNVYGDYGSLLLPRAVGYSAGLLNYFFRGQMDMDPDADTQGRYIIKNKSGETMNGNFALYYDAGLGNRYQVPGASWSMSINANSPSSSLTFTPPTDTNEKGKYIIAFQGTLGSETNNAVVGKVVDICAKASGLNISGPDNITGTAQYTASGGIAPYTWSISNGSISKDGVVTILDQCASGTAVITVTDYCGKTQTKIVTISPAEPLSISGTDTPSDGSQYTASGGKGPYTYSISKGSITPDGTVTLSGQCGTVTITATDSCGNSASKTIDMGSCGGGGGGGTLCTGDTPELVISGTDTPSDGDSYAAAGGTAPYSWSISMGSITPDGIVTISNQCGGAGTITVTDACGKTQTKDITIPLPSAITISGPDAPTNGSQYGAEGGIAPYTWAITKGSITDGVVFVSNQCGSATVTAGDSCGNTASKDVRMPSGRWVLVGSSCDNSWCMAKQYSCPTLFASIAECRFNYIRCSTVSGGAKTEYWYTNATYYGCGTSQCPTAPCATGEDKYYNGKMTYEWRCQ